MLFNKLSKFLLLFSIILFFSSCANKHISKEELQTNSYLINIPCQKEENSKKCNIKSKITQINSKKITPYLKDNQEYFRLKEGINKINIESEFYTVPYIFETTIKIDVIDNNHYTLKYKINPIEDDKLEVKYQLVSDDKIIREFTPKYMRSKDEESISSKIKEYSIIGLKSILLIINIALDIAYITK